MRLWESERINIHEVGWVLREEFEDIITTNRAGFRKAVVELFNNV